MDVYNPHKYCMVCKNPFTRQDPNPKFLSCKHFMCTSCFSTAVEGQKVKCACGKHSTLPIPEHRVFPDMGESDLNTYTRRAISSPRDTMVPVSNVALDSSLNMQQRSNTPWSRVLVDSFSSQPQYSLPLPSNTITNKPVTNMFGNYDILDWEESSLGPIGQKPKNGNGKQALNDDVLAPSSSHSVLPKNQVQNTNSSPIWTSLFGDIVFGNDLSSGSGAQWITRTNLWKSSRCVFHNLEKELHCGPCGTYMCAICVLSADHAPSHAVTIRPKAVFYSTRFPDVILVLREHAETIERFSEVVSNYENPCRPHLFNFTRRLVGAMIHSFNCLREKERRNIELATSNTLNSIAFENTQNETFKEFDDYRAVKNSLENMIWGREIENPGSGKDLLLNMVSLIIFHISRNPMLPGTPQVMTESSRNVATVEAATNTELDERLATLQRRAELAQKLLDPAAIIPEGWFINTLPNVFFIEFSTGLHTIGRVLIETNPDLAPVMSANFALLCDKTRNLSYQDCVVFQCWPGQSIITGDTETKNGTGGRSVLNDDFVVPDDSRLTSFRGAVGMRRLKKRISKACEISSQFRIMLYENKCITGIFGRVVKGIEIVEEIAKFGDVNGNPKKVIRISNCGKIQSL